MLKFLLIHWAFSGVAAVAGLPEGPPTRADAGTDDLIPKIFADWEKRRERVPVVRYRLKGTRFWARGSFNDDSDLLPPGRPLGSDNPKEDITGQVTRTVLIDLPHNRFRVEFDEANYSNLARKTYRIHCLVVGDGSAVHSRIFENTSPSVGRGRAKPHVDLVIRRGDPQIIPPGVFESGYLPVFVGEGIITYQGVRVRPTALAPRIGPEGFTYHGRGEHGGRDCAIIRRGELEVWVDQARDSAVVRIFVNPNRGALYEVEYQETPQGWLPKSWVKARYAGTKLVFSERVEVEGIDLHPQVSSETFKLPVKPGMYVDDITYVADPEAGGLRSEHRYYRVESGSNVVPLDRSLHPLGQDRRPGGSP